MQLVSQIPGFVVGSVRGRRKVSQKNLLRPPRATLELQNRDLWLRPTDLSWHFLILMTIREELVKNFRSWTSEKWKAKEDKIEEVSKKKTKKGDDEWNDAEWQPSSCSLQQPMTWTSSSSSSSWQQCVGCDIVQADHAPEAGVAQGIFHGILVRHHRNQEEVEEGLEEEVERRVEENTQEQVRMSMTMDGNEDTQTRLEPM